MNGAAIAVAYAFDRKGRAGYQTPVHRVSQTVAKKESDRRRSKAGEATKRYLDNRQAEDGHGRTCPHTRKLDEANRRRISPSPPSYAGCPVETGTFELSGSSSR